MLTAFVLAAALQAPAPPSPACLATYEAQEKKLLPAMDEGNWKVVEPVLDRLDKVCAGHPNVTGLLATWRAKMRLGQGRTAEAIALLEQPVVAASTSRASGQWLLLSAYELQGDASGFRRVRDAMLADNDAAMSGGKPELTTRKIERFETPAAVVDVYAGPFRQRRFIRDYVFVATPKNGAMFATIALTHYPPEMQLSQESEAYFVDAYHCGGRMTLEQISTKPGEAPAYEAIKAKAMSVFSSPSLFGPQPAVNAVSAFNAPGTEAGELRDCAFKAYMLPGIG